MGVVGGGYGAGRALGWSSGPLMAINGAADWLAERGRIPEYHLLIDPLPRLARFVQTPRTQTRYLVGTCCAFEVFDALDGHDITVFEVAYRSSDIGERIPGGPSAATRAPIIAAHLGHKETRLFGCGCSYEDDGSSHVWGNREERRIAVECDGKRFLTSPDLIVQAEWLAEYVPSVPQLPLFVDDEDSLLAAMIRTRGEWHFAKEPA